MSHVPSQLVEYLHKQLREAFGEPNNSRGGDHHWSVRPAGTNVAINLLLNGGSSEPIVWVFDPHSPDDGVVQASINEAADADEIIANIRARIERAASARRHD